MIKSALTAAAITLMSSPVFASTTYDDTVTFSASAACSELTGVKYPSEASDTKWQNYLQCIEVLHYFDTKY